MCPPLNDLGAQKGRIIFDFGGGGTRSGNQLTKKADGWDLSLAARDEMRSERLRLGLDQLVVFDERPAIEQELVVFRVVHSFLVVGAGERFDRVPRIPQGH